MARLLILLLAVLCLAPPASAFSVRVVIDGVATRWKNPSLEYYIQYAGSDDLSPEESLDTVRKAFEAWRSIDCSAVDFVELGDAPNPYATVLTGSGPDGVNSLVWIEDEAWTLGKWVLGVTGPIITQDGSLVEADIAFNGYHLTWTTDGKGGTDLESVAVHEIGHMFGMQHNLGPYNWSEPPTLTPNIQPKLKSRTPEWDDQMCACFLYPEGGVWNCESDAECPKILGQTADGQDTYIGAFVCDDTDKVCNDPKMWANTSNLGETCEFNSTCADDLFCYPWSESGICTSTCKMDGDDCPEDFSCEAVDEFPLYGVCVPAGGDAFAPGTGPSGCASSLVCQEGDSCLPVPSGEKKLCTTICDLAANNCPEGEGCWDYGTGKTNGACFEYDLWPGGDPNGADSAPESVEETDIVGDDSGKEELPPAPSDIGSEGIASADVQVPPTNPTPVADSGCGVTAPAGGKSYVWFVVVLLLAGLYRRRERFGLVREDS